MEIFTFNDLLVEINCLLNIVPNRPRNQKFNKLNDSVISKAPDLQYHYSCPDIVQLSYCVPITSRRHLYLESSGQLIAVCLCVKISSQHTRV